MKLFLSLLLLLANGFATISAQTTSSTENQQKEIDAFIRGNNAKRAENPDGLLFTIRFKDNRKQFFQGELIQLELSFAALKPETFTLSAATYDRSGRLEIDDFIIDRQDDLVDPLHDYFHSGLHGFIGGGLSSTPELTDKPYLITAELNEWMRFDKRGHYRLYVVSGRVGRKDASGEPDVFAVVSNVIEFEILSQNKKWATQKLNEAITALSKTDVDHRSACRTLRFLGTTAAVSEMRKRFRGDDDNCEWQYQFGLIGSPHRDFVIREMENALSSPEQPITSTFLNTLALLQFTSQSTALPPYPAGTDEQNNQWQAQLQQRRNAYDKLRLNYLRQLVMAIPQKQGQARATSLQTLLDYQSELNTSDFSEWSTLLTSMPDVFSRLPLDDQIRLLQYQWKPIASVAMLPVLRTLLKDKSNSHQQEELRSVALRRLYELSPVEGRALILDEIRSPKPRVNERVLRSLPDKTLPELDLVLAANLQESRRPNGIGDTEAISELIERYATAEILPRVRAVYEAPGVGKWACRIQASLLAYLLRVDPSSGGEYLNKALAARGENFTRCYTTTLMDVAKLHMSAEVEDAATAALEDEDPELLSQAASVLEVYGSADAEKALWRRLEKWHEAMQSRSKELSKQNPGLPAYTGTDLSGQALIEDALLHALMNGRAWLSEPEKLKRLRDLCLTDSGRDKVARIIRDWNHYLYVGLNSVADELHSISVGHYHLKSLDSLKKKLLQFPKGTIFKWTAPFRSDDSHAQKVFQHIKSYLEEHGMKLEREPVRMVF